MTEAKLFQYAIIWNPSTKEAKDGKKAEMIKEVSTILAGDEQKAFMLAARLIPEDKLDQLDQIQVVVRAF